MSNPIKLETGHTVEWAKEQAIIIGDYGKVMDIKQKFLSRDQLIVNKPYIGKFAILLMDSCPLVYKWLNETNAHNHPEESLVLYCRNRVRGTNTLIANKNRVMASLGLTEDMFHHLIML